jgi:hypothetical protein
MSEAWREVLKYLETLLITLEQTLEAHLEVSHWMTEAWREMLWYLETLLKFLG